ncbi:MAG: winged helix-turn-helix transcriptional regulator [Candidatus Izemoplasmataceae bacterium]
MTTQDICPKFEKAISLLSKRWVGLIVYQLLDEPKRFGDLQDEIKLSSKVLSERLKDLEKEGIIMRNVYPETPVRIEYTLTDKGRTLKASLESIHQWADEWIKL